MAGPVMIEWVGLEGMAGRIRALAPYTTRGLDRVLKQQAMIAEGDAKVSAPWTDRTGAARNGLYGSSHVTPTQGVLEVGHTVDYGIWLEIRHAGRFAVINQTLGRAVPRVAQAIKGLW